jgi:hypothetical protein
MVDRLQNNSAINIPSKREIKRFQSLYFLKLSLFSINLAVKVM